MHDWTDESLVQAAQGGDVRAFETLVRRHEAFVVGAALRVVRNASTAEDLAQESFFRAWRGLSSFRGDSQFRTWMYRIATNLALNHVSRGREDATEDIPELRPVDSTTDVVVASGMESAWRSVVASMPDELRQPYELREFEDQSYGEIAEALSVPLNTIRTRIHRARKLVNNTMKEWS